MTKREFLIAILQKLEPHRSLVTGFLALIQSPLATEEDIDNIFDLIESKIDSIQDEEIRTKTKESFNLLKEIQKREAKDRVKEQVVLEKLLNDLNTL